MLGVAEQQAREHEQVVELELARGAAGGDVVARELGEGDRVVADHRVRHVEQHRPSPFGQCDDALAQVLEVATP